MSRFLTELSFHQFNHKDWLKLTKRKKPITGFTNVMIQNCWDIHPASNPVFLDTSLVVLKNCDKNFIYYWARKDTFPKLKTLYLLSHPCKSSMFHLWNDAGVQVIMSERYEQFQRRWAIGMKNVRLIGERQEEDIFGSNDLN
jgi:hypothetical protein